MSRLPQISPHRMGPRDIRGVTLLELMVTLLLTMSLLASVTTSFLMTTRRAADHETFTKTEEQARAILDLIVYDLRMSGAGMPLGQDDFAIGNPSLGNAPLPLLTTADASYLELRLNDGGKTSVLMSDYTPSAVDLSFGVFDGSNFKDGDVIYISDMIAGGKSGLRGRITGVSGNTISIDSDYVATSGATFNEGSIVAPVRTIYYESPNSGSGILRTIGDTTPVLVFPKSSFSLVYLDAAGIAIPPPLTDSIIRNDLTSIRITVTVTSQRPLRDGDEYIATAEDEVMLRNLVINR